MALTNGKALLPICSEATIQKLKTVEKNEVLRVVHSLLEEILVFKRIENSQSFKRALEVASHYVHGLYLAFLDQEILVLVSDFTLNNLEVLFNSLKGYSSERYSLCTTDNGEGVLSSNAYYASQTFRGFIKMISHTTYLRKIIEKLLDIAQVILDVYKQMPLLGYSLTQTILDALESGVVHYFGPKDAESLFTSLLNFLKYSITVNNDVQTSCLIASTLSILVSYVSFPSMKISFGSRVARFLELLFERNLLSQQFCVLGQGSSSELLMKLTIPLFGYPYQDLSSLSSSSLHKILYLLSVYGHPVCYNDGICSIQRNYEIQGYCLEPMKKKQKSLRPTNSLRVFYETAEHLLRLLSHTDAELSALQAQIYEIGAIVAIQRLSMIGTSLNYLKQNVQGVNHLLLHLTVKYRSVVSDGFQIVMDRIDPSSSVAHDSISFLKDLLITFDCLFSISEDDHAKHITFPVLELGLNVLNHLKHDESREVEYICRQFTEICTWHFSSCQVTDAKAAMNFINFVLSKCSNVTLSKSVSFVDEMYFLILEKSLHFLRQISGPDIIPHDNSLSYIDFRPLNTWLSHYLTECSDHSELTIEEIKDSNRLGTKFA
ncbi:Serine/threonine-protein kinase ATR [Galdieria sulphuraria]|nr:Serine/threonine-protein kinase ATR [Galdieria sulphuraria]